MSSTNIATERAAQRPSNPHRSDKYPRHLSVDFRRAKLSTLKRYIRTFEVPLKSDPSDADYAIAVARHFNEEKGKVDEDHITSRFINYLKKTPAEPEDKRLVSKRSRSADERTKRKKKSRKDAEDADGAAAGAGAEEDEEEQRLYCFCRRISFGDMIGCDNDDCRYEWFHLPCVGLAPGKRPRGKWFCPECQKNLDDAKGKK